MLELVAMFYRNIMYQGCITCVELIKDLSHNAKISRKEVLCSRVGHERERERELELEFLSSIKRPILTYGTRVYMCS